MPICRSTLRLTSAMRTIRLTWVGAATFSRLTTRVGSSTNCAATSMMLVACSGDCTVPEITSDWSTVVAVTEPPGATRASPSFRAPVLWVTRTRADISTLSSSSTAKIVVSPTPTPVM